MKVYLTDQQPRFREHLEYFRNAPLMPYNRSDLKEITSTTPINTQTSLQQLDLTCLFDYHIFPTNIMTALPEWAAESRPMRAGDTIVQQGYIPPVRSLSQKIVFAVRINQIIDEPARRGFSYETVKGHVEKGISTFTVEQTGNGLIFKIHSISGPGHLLSRLVGPIFSAPYQAYCTRQALRHVRAQLER